MKKGAGEGSMTVSERLSTQIKWKSIISFNKPSPKRHAFQLSAIGVVEACSQFHVNRSTVI